MSKFLALKPEDYRDERKLVSECQRLTQDLTICFLEMNMLTGMAGMHCQSEGNENLDAMYYSYAEHDIRIKQHVMVMLAEDLNFVAGHLSATWIEKNRRRSPLKPKALKAVETC